MAAPATEQSLMSETIAGLLRALYGKPCWNVQHGYWLSFLTFDFGEPRVVIHEPREQFQPREGEKRSWRHKRMASVRGEWHLRIDDCSWLIFQDDEPIGHSEDSNEEQDRAVVRLQGQALIEAVITPDGRRTRFTFDLGGVIHTRAWTDQADHPRVQWTLADSTGYWLSIREDGKYNYVRDDAPRDTWEWLPL